MSDTLFVDTGYVIALINQTDQHHRQALQLADQYEGTPIVTTDAILLEIGNALSRIARNEASAIMGLSRDMDKKVQDGLKSYTGLSFREPTVIEK
ncbi:MAG: hypothetical protein H7126_12425 [Candidatus Parcubacteria bacterium]|nr:hypothetical protein [Leptolyngbyaceae cyanobacterium LF-bin-113]